ncbi:MAG: hypothetical protein K2R98_09360 [Gemmataceae bacterium]|nr:hypothetical protein [Gemmataceae bacterium]
MPPTDDVVGIYEELAEREDERGAAQMRDRFLILAADAALSLGRNDRAEELRRRLLDQNPHHLLRPYPTLADALKSPDVFSYVVDLRASYAPEEAEQLLMSMRAGGSGTEGELPRPKPIAPPPKPEPEEEPEIFAFSRGQEVSEAQEPAPPADVVAEEPSPVAPPRPAKPKRARLKPSEAALAMPDVYPYHTTSVPAAPRTDAERPSAVSAFVSTALFLLLLAAGLALAGYTLARPFLPM